MRRVLIMGMTVLLAACASGPRPVGGPIEGSPDLRRVLSDPEAFRGQRVRWGGVIVSVQNQPKDSVVEVVARELDDDGKPQSDEEGGRFLAEVPGFLDPEVYAPGRLFTVTGMLDRPVTRNIGDYPYHYPVVKADKQHLWKRETVRPTRGYYYDPFWDPWYPYYYRPWPYGPRWPYW
jgi:outer membrane lipoprotein